ncbi:MAG: Ig-like domain-containing protein [Candidatus Hadarchaeales archaeon]
MNGPGTFYRAGSGRQYAEFFKDGSGNYKFFSDESWSPGNYQPDVYYIATLSLYDNDKIRARFYYGRDNENYRYLLWEAPEKIRNWNYATDPNNYCDKYVLAAWDTGGDSSYYFDWFFVRKYAAVEPTTTVGSEMMAILPTAPKLISPYNTSTITDNTPTFIWEKGEYAENHRLLVGNDNDFGSPAINVLLGPNDETYTPTVELSDGKYYWKVMAINEAGESSSEVWSFRIDTTPPVAPTLISPQNGLNTNNKRPTFSWSSVPENSTPVEYYAALSDNPAFTYENFNTSWILSTTFSPPGDIPDGLWYWRVKARDSVWNVGPWSETWSFRIDTVPPQAPTITAPSNGANINDNTPTISWQPVIENSTPVLYRVVLDDDPNFQSIDRDSGWISSTSWTVSPALPNGVWYCRVAAKDNAGNVGENSQIWFRVDTVPPQLPEKVWPEDGAIINDNTPTLVWQNVYENSLPIVYIIQVDNEPSFTDSLTLTVENWEISGTSSVTLPELPDNVYYWRVSARDNAGNITWDSGFWKFTLDSLYPVLRYPENGKTIADNTPRLEWENAAVADYWEVWLDDDADFSSPLILENTTENYFDVADVFSGGLPDGIYYWRVRGWRNGENHLFSEVWTFEISLIFPVLVSPENGENLKLPPTLRWDNLTVADNWEVWVDNDPDFSPPNVILENTSDNYYNLSTLDDGVYYWRVRGWKAGSNMFSEIRWFRIDTIPPAAPSLVSPSDGENTNDNTPTLVWNNVFENSLPVVYTIEVDNEDTFTAPLAFTTTLTVWSTTGTSNVTTPVLQDGVYYWRVRARDNAGNESGWSSVQRFRVDTIPPAAPQVVGPENGKNLTVFGASVTIPAENSYPLIVGIGFDDNEDFSSVDNVLMAIFYLPKYIDNSVISVFAADILMDASNLIHVDNSGYPSQVIHRYQSGSVIVELTINCAPDGTIQRITFVQYSPLLRDGVYYAISAAIDDAGNMSDFSNIRWFRLDTVPPAPPVLVSPANRENTNDNTPTLVWNNVFENSLPVVYTIEVDNEDTFTAPLVFTTTLTVWSTTGTSSVITPVLPDGVYYWRVRARDNAGNEGPWSSVWRFRVDTIAPPAPTLISPENGLKTKNTTITFVWSAVSDNSLPIKYYISFSDVSNFSHENYGTWTENTSMTANNVPDGLWYWRVKAKDNAGNEGPWSAIWCVRVDTVPPAAPILVSPTNGENTSDNTPRLTWQVPFENSLPLSFQVQVATDNGFSNIVRTSAWVFDNYWEVSPALPDNVYYWRVKARDNAGNEGSWSSVWSFRVVAAPPATPSLIAPANGSWIEENRPTLRWTAVVDPSGIKYVVQVDNENTFSSPLVHENVNVIDNFYTLPIALPEGLYFWRVKAVSGSGLESGWSSIWSFGVDNSIPSAPTIVSPITGENTNDNTPTLIWQRVVDPSGIKYEIQIDNDENFTSPFLTRDNLTNENYVLENALPDGKWYWRVRAVDGAGHASAWSTSWFIVDTVPPTVSLTQTPPSTTSETSVSYSGTATDVTTIVVAVEYRVNAGNWVNVSITKGKTVSFSFTISNLAPGSYTVEVRAKDNAGNYSSPVSHTFTVTAGDFSISVSPENIKIKHGENKTVTITITAIEGFSQEVSLSISGLPGGVSASFSPQSGTPTFTSTLTITATPVAEPGVYTLTVTASGGGRTHTATITLTVETPPAPGPAVSWAVAAAIAVAVAVVIIIILKFFIFA